MLCSGYGKNGALSVLQVSLAGEGAYGAPAELGAYKGVVPRVISALSKACVGEVNVAGQVPVLEHLLGIPALPQRSLEQPVNA